MSEIEIDCKPKVFDDPTHCKGELRKEGKCTHLKELSHLAVCRMFRHNAGERYRLIFGDSEIPEKCPQCKEAYQRAKSNGYPESLERRKPQ